MIFKIISYEKLIYVSFRNYIRIFFNHKFLLKMKKLIPYTLFYFVLCTYQKQNIEFFQYILAEILTSK